MARISRLMMPVCLCFMVLVPTFSSAQSARPYSQRATNKVRANSYLVNDLGLKPDLIDRRNPQERRRDQELYKHYNRLAELDIILQVATKTKDIALQERAEQIRRLEMQRYYQFMQLLNQPSTTQMLAKQSKR